MRAKSYLWNRRMSENIIHLRVWYFVSTAFRFFVHNKSLRFCRHMTRRVGRKHKKIKSKLMACFAIKCTLESSVCCIQVSQDCYKRELPFVCCARLSIASNHVLDCDNKLRWIYCIKSTVISHEWYQ